MIDPIAALGLLSDLVRAIAQSVNSFQKTPKQEFAKELLILFDLLKEVEIETSRVVSDLKAFQTESTIGRRVHYIHSAGQHLERLEQAITEFIDWVAHSRRWIFTLEVLALKAKEALVRLEELEIDMAIAARRFNEVLKILRSELQAVPSPDPKQFAQSSYTLRVIKQMETLLSDIQQTRELIRDFALAHLSIEDLFAK